MRKAVEMDRWNHTAKLQQTLINLKASRKVDFEECHPFMNAAKPWESIKHQLINDNGHGIRR